MNLQVKCKTYFMWQISKVKGKKCTYSRQEMLELQEHNCNSINTQKNTPNKSLAQNKTKRSDF